MSHRFAQSFPEVDMRNLKSRRAYAALFAAALIIATSCSDPEARTGGSSAAVSPADAAVKGSMEEGCKGGQQEGELGSWDNEGPEAYEKIFADVSQSSPGVKLT